MKLTPLLLFALATVASAQPRYEVVDLGLGLAYGINQKGDVCGFYVPRGSPQGSYQAFLYTQGKLRDLGTGPNSVAFGINESDEVVGSIRGLPGSAFLYRRGRIITVLGGGASANAISDNGEVVGETGGAETQGFIWVNGSVRILKPLNNAGENILNGVNNAGVVVGESGNAFEYRDGRMQVINPYSSDAMAINQHGHVTGSESFELNRAFLYNGTVQTLPVVAGMVNGVGVAINDSDEVVGYDASADWSVDVPFLYRNNAVYAIRDLLVTKGWTMGYASGINDQGEIVGGALKADGSQHAVLLKPVK
jgi:probable HAF family extracellular repeat protein